MMDWRDRRCRGHPATDVPRRRSLIPRRRGPRRLTTPCAFVIILRQDFQKTTRRPKIVAPGWGRGPDRTRGSGCPRVADRVDIHLVYNGLRRSPWSWCRRVRVGVFRLPRRARSPVCGAEIGSPDRRRGGWQAPAEGVWLHNSPKTIRSRPVVPIIRLAARAPRRRLHAPSRDRRPPVPRHRPSAPPGRASTNAACAARRRPQ
jgi:hypothetical protein